MRALVFLGLTLLLYGPADAGAPPQRSVDTLWPAVLPCERFNRLEFRASRHDGYRVNWNQEGGAPLRFRVPPYMRLPGGSSWVGTTPTVKLDATFPAGRLTRIQLQAERSGATDRVGIELVLYCPPEEGDGSITWRCEQSPCIPETTYAIPEKEPRERFLYTHRWVTVDPKQQPAPRLEVLLRPALDRSEHSELLALGRDLVHDAEPVMRLACARGRCAESVTRRLAMLQRLAQSDAWSIDQVESDTGNIRFIASSGPPATRLTAQFACEYVFVHHVGHQISCFVDVDNLRHTQLPSWDFVMLDKHVVLSSLDLGSLGATMPLRITLSGAAQRLR